MFKVIYIICLIVIIYKFVTYMELDSEKYVTVESFHKDFDRTRALGMLGQPVVSKETYKSSIKSNFNLDGEFLGKDNLHAIEESVLNCGEKNTYWSKQGYNRCERNDDNKKYDYLEPERILAQEMEEIALMEIACQQDKERREDEEVTIDNIWFDNINCNDETDDNWGSCEYYDIW